MVDNSLYDSIIAELREIYEDPARRYHNINHIESMLDNLDLSVHLQLVKHPVRVRNAIWFHDAVYDATRTDNEIQSSALWMRKMTPLLVDEPLQWGKRAILATIEHLPNDDPDIQLLLDLDLASLGASWEVFQANTQAIRREYSHVSDEDFRKGRLDFLEGMLARRQIYGTKYWHEKLEQKAIENLEKAIKCLVEQ